MAFGFKPYGADHGLTSTSITALVQDPGGFLWVGTEDGLFRLEGERFRRFGTEEGLPSNSIIDLSIARPRGIWIETNNGIVLWDGGRFRRPSSLGLQGFDDRPGLPLPAGGIIISHYQSQQRFFSPSDGSDFLELKGLPWGGGAYSAFFDPERKLLVLALMDGFWEWNGTNWKSRVLFDASVKNKAVTSVCIDRRGRYWLRQPERLFRLDRFDAPLVQVPTPEPLSAINSTFLAEDALGRIWTNTARSLIWISESGSGVLGERQGLPPGGAFVFFIDSQDTLWAGGDGVFKLLGDFLWKSSTRAQGLPGEVTWSVLRTRDGRVWAGTAEGLAYGTPQGWRIVPGSERFPFMALFEDAKGVVWAGHSPLSETTSGILKILPGRTEARPVAISGGKLTSVVCGIAQGPGDSLWLATTLSGLYRAFPEPGGLKIEALEIPGWPASEGAILNIAGDGSGGLWVAGDPGAAHWDGRSWAVLPKQSLRDQNMISVLPIGPDSAWLAPKNGKQLSRILREGSVLRLTETLPRAHPLSQALIFGLGRDSRGVIWVATARGLLRWENGRVEKYGRNAGLPGEDCAQNALWVDPNGDVWAGLSVGLAHGEMRLWSEPQRPPPAAILDARDGADRSLFDIGPETAIPWKVSSVFFRFAARGSKWTEGIGFQVRLVGLEDAWRTTDVNEARYPKLPAGHYRFEVRTFSAAREFGTAEGVDFWIIAPWWRRWWAQVIWSLLFLGLVGLVFWRRTKVLRRRNEFLEAMIEARTGELEQANEALREAVLIDPLTGLYNRRYLTITMPEEEARLRRMFRNYFMKGISPLNQNEDLILFLGDMDHFKTVNDTHGHAAGDLMIQETAKVLKSVCRTADTLVRWGGEEFILVARRSDREKAGLIAEKLCQAVREHELTLPAGPVLRCTISFGFAAFPILDQHPEAFTWEDTLQLADQCLYEAKNAGRNGWVGVLATGPLNTPEYAPRLRSDLKGLIRESQVLVESSFPPDRVFR